MRILSVFFLICSVSLFAQKHTISGYITDKTSGEPLIGATVLAKGSLDGVAANAYGFYSITLPQDSVELAFSFVGYSVQSSKFWLHQDETLNIEMTPKSELSGVTINADQVDRIEENTQMSTIRIPIKNIKSLPALFGEVDVLKAIQLLPGVQSGTEGTSGFYVRGGGPDQNLILLDGTPVYNASHLFGIFSVFNPDAINNIELVKGGFPARYGGRLSSVLDISLKEGNMKKWTAEGAIGLVSSKLTLEGPLVKDKMSLIVSARRTYVDLFIRPLAKLTTGNNRLKQGYYFYDLNAKLNYKVGDKDRIYLSTYMGDDKFFNEIKPQTYLFEGNYFTDERRDNQAWGNRIVALRWNHQFSNRLFANSSLTYSRYNFETGQFFKQIQESDTGLVNQVNSSGYRSGIEDYAAKLDFDYYASPNHFIKFGVQGIKHQYSPGVLQVNVENPSTEIIDSVLGADIVNAIEYAAYIEDDIKVNSRLKANVGVHYSGFVVDDAFYQSIQPRIAARYLMGNQWSLKASYAKMQQYVHLLTNSSVGLPTDLWVPATDRVRPQLSDQVALGLAKRISNTYEFTLEGYYKTMANVIEYKDGASYQNSSDNWEDKIEVGNGYAYGMEAFIQKKIGNTTGWIGYTLSWANRQFDNINFGEVFPYKYDRRHDVSIVLNQALSDKWEFSTSWVYGTGNALTLPSVQYQAAVFAPQHWWDEVGAIQHFESRNDFRAAAYNRLDIGFRRHRQRKWGEGILNFGVYNAYSRNNPFYYYIGTDNLGYKALKRVSLLPFIPSISWSFKFNKAPFTLDQFKNRIDIFSNPEKIEETH